MQVPKSQRLIVLLLLAIVLLLQACGQTAAEADLSGTEWEVIDMIGFPADTVVEGSIRLTSGDFFYDDGVNVGSSSIQWTGTGFDVTELGTSTSAEAGPRYLALFIGGPGNSVTTTLTNETLTLTRDGFTVVAKPGKLGS